MARFLNPDNSAFQIALNSKIYVDKTMPLNYTNMIIDTNVRKILSMNVSLKNLENKRNAL